MAEFAPEAGPDNLRDLGGLEKELGVREERNRVESQEEIEEEEVGTWDATQEERIPKIHKNLDPDAGADLPGYRITEADF